MKYSILYLFFFFLSQEDFLILNRCHTNMTWSQMSRSRWSGYLYVSSLIIKILSCLQDLVTFSHVFQITCHAHQSPRGENGEFQKQTNLHKVRLYVMFGLSWKWEISGMILMGIAIKCTLQRSCKVVKILKLVKAVINY